MRSFALAPRWDGLVRIPVGSAAAAFDEAVLRCDLTCTPTPNIEQRSLSSATVPCGLPCRAVYRAVRAAMPAVGGGLWLG